MQFLPSDQSLIGDKGLENNKAVKTFKGLSSYQLCLGVHLYSFM